MEHKPYETASAYDVYFLGLCRELYGIIQTHANRHRTSVDLDEEDCRDLAYVITDYFQDVTGNIGFWDAMVQLNQQHFHKRVPLFSKDVIAEDQAISTDIHYVDIYYLLFINYMALMNAYGDGQTLIFFETKFFHELTNALLDRLDEIEEVPTTDFYTRYLVPDEDYIHFKTKLDWFTFHGYLTRIQFEDLSLEALDNFVSQEVESEFLPLLMHGEEDRLKFEVPSYYTAFFPLDIFAGALKCSSEKKQEIINLKFRPHGIFHVQQEFADSYIFLHTATSEEYRVMKSSFNRLPDTKSSEYFITTLAYWNGTYHISGLCLPSPYEGEEIYRRNIQEQHSFQRHYEPYRRELLNNATEYRNRAVEYFGKELIEFETGFDLQQKLNDFLIFYNESRLGQKSQNKSQIPAKIELPAALKKAGGIALFIPPANGISFITVHRVLMDILQTSTPEDVSMDRLQEALAALLDDSVDAAYWFYLRKHFDLPNLNSFAHCNVDSNEDFNAFLRIYKPQDFSPLKLPRFTTFTSERMAPEEAAKLFSVRSNAQKE